MESTPCRTCSQLKCRTQGKDCYNIQNESLTIYKDDHINQLSRHASKLIDNGRAGTLSRIEEVIEFCQQSNYSRIGLAYCFGLQPLAMELCKVLEQNNISVLPIACSAGAVEEKAIDPTKSNNTISCNPVGQALALNKYQPQLVLEMGLCLGHDMIFHKHLQVPYTVIMVKDRVYHHNPLLALTTYQDKNSHFLKTMDDSFHMKSAQWLQQQVSEASDSIQIIDVRSSQAFQKMHIPHALSIPLPELPSRYTTLERSKTTICVCNGSVQSAYAIMFLYSRGFKTVYNLSGGMGAWRKIS